MFHIEKDKKKRFKIEKGYNAVQLAAPIMTMFTFMHIGDEEPITHFSGLITFLGMIIAITFFLWHEIERIYPADAVKKKRIHAILSALVGTAITPLLIVLLPLQIYFLYKKQKITQLHMPEQVKDDNVQYYLIAVGCIVISYCVYMHYMITTVS